MLLGSGVEGVRSDYHAILGKSLLFSGLAQQLVVLFSKVLQA